MHFTYTKLQRLVATSLLAVLAGCTVRAEAPQSNHEPHNSARVGSFGTFGWSKIRHVVIIIQENRTPDNLFNGFPGADTVTSGKNSHGATVPLQQGDLATPYDLDHSHKGFVTEYAAGAMDGFDLEQSGNCQNCPPKETRAYVFVKRDQVLPYWQMAQQYTFADRMFQTNEGPSFPAHQYLISGTSLASTSSALLASENPLAPDGTPTGGCDSPPGSLVELIDPATGIANTKIFPCFDHPTLIDRLNQAGISWKYYQPVITSGLWYAPDAIRHLRDDPTTYSNIVAPNTAVISAAQNGTLPAVSWVIPTAAESDHAKTSNGTGPSWVASVVNAIGTSRYWNSTAIIITWDDWGGWYDHVKPPIHNQYEDGFRVPLIIVSPYARKGYVSHEHHEFGSILKFVERIYGLSPVGYTDVRSDDLSDCFNFGQTPIPFQPIVAPVPVSYFEKLPVTSASPDDDGL